MNSINRKYFLLLILPVVYLFFSGVFFINWRPFYTLCADPVYIYLFTGMNIGAGKLSIHYIDNPGIPVQYFCALVIYVKHFFNHSIPLYQDLLLHPESYLYAICVAISLLWVLITLYTGYYVLKRTANLPLALLFQLTPLIAKEYLTSSAPSPESFILLFGVPFIAYLFCNLIYSDKSSQRKTGIKQLLIYASFSAFLITCKYTCFPLFFLVVFLLPGTRSRLQYLVLFLLVFISPAIPVMSQIVDWLTNIATHKGSYGQGEKGFANSSEFTTNLGKIFSKDMFFTSIYVLMIISLITGFIKRKQIQPANSIYLRLLTGIFASSLILIILVAKHYSFHYLIPIQLCLPLIIAGSAGLLRDFINVKTPQLKFAFPAIIYLFSAYLVIPDLKGFFFNLPKAVSSETADFIDKYGDTPIVITAGFASSRIEPAIELGVAYAGNFNNKYWEFLKRIYPNTYRTIHPSKSVSHWDDIFYMPELFSKHKKIIAYFNEQDSAGRASFLKEFCIWGKDTIAQKKLVYARKESNEFIYELDGNQTMAKTMMDNPVEINFDLERLTSDKSKSISSDGKDTLGGINSLTTKEHHSRNNSVLMNHDNQFALNYAIHSKRGSLIVTKIWRKSDDGWGGIAFTSKSNGDFYAFGHAVIDSDSHGWKQIEYKCLVPSSFNDGNINLYLFYYGNGYAYFDDLSITIYPMNLNNSNFTQTKTDRN